MILRFLALAAAAALCASADDGIDGPTGANNASQPTEQDGDITIHFVSVGKATNEFVVSGSAIRRLNRPY